MHVIDAPAFWIGTAISGKYRLSVLISVHSGFVLCIVGTAKRWATSSPGGLQRTVGLRAPSPTPKLRAPPHHPASSSQPINTLPFHNHSHNGDLHRNYNRLPVPTTLLLPALLHPTTRRNNALLTAPILVHIHPILLPPPPHLLALPNRRTLNAALPQHHALAAALPARRKSNSHMDGVARGRAARRVH